VSLVQIAALYVPLSIWSCDEGEVWGHVYAKKKRVSTWVARLKASPQAAATSVLVSNLITFYTESAVDDSESIDNFGCQLNSALKLKT
jgi:hypothetical protein